MRKLWHYRFYMSSENVGPTTHKRHSQHAYRRATAIQSKCIISNWQLPGNTFLKAALHFLGTQYYNYPAALHIPFSSMMGHAHNLNINMMKMPH